MVDKYSITKSAEIIRAKREKLGYTQDYVAEQLGLKNRQSISKLENGTQPPSWEQIVKLCNVFNCDVGFLIGEHETEIHEYQNVINITGLSNEAIAKLWNLKNNRGYESKQMLDIINALLVSPNINELLNKLFQVVELAKLCAYYEVEYPDIDFNAGEFLGKFYVSSSYDDWDETQALNENEKMKREVHIRYKDIKKQHDLPRYYAEKSFSRFVDEYVNAIPNTFDLEEYETRLDELEDEHKRIKEDLALLEKMEVGLKESIQHYSKLRKAKWYRRVVEAVGSEDLEDISNYLREQYTLLEEKKKRIMEKEANKNGKRTNS